MARADAAAGTDAAGLASAAAAGADTAAPVPCGALVLACYGTAWRGAAEAAIAPVLRAVSNAAGVPCELAFTSAAVCEKLAARGERAPLLEDVLERVARRGARRVAVLPGLVVGGWAYADLCVRARSACRGLGFEHVDVGRPLLGNERDVAEFARVLERAYPHGSRRAVLFVGHGVHGPAGCDPAHDASAFDAYAALDTAFAHGGRCDLAVSTLSTDSGDVARRVGERFAAGCTVKLVPLMLTAGHHVQKQLRAMDECSLCARIALSGRSVEVDDRGLGEHAEVQELFCRRAREQILAMKREGTIDG